MLFVVGVTYAASQIQREDIGGSFVVGRVLTPQETILLYSELGPSTSDLVELDFGTGDLDAFGFFLGDPRVPFWAQNGGAVPFDLIAQATDVTVNGEPVSGDILVLLMGPAGGEMLPAPDNAITIGTGDPPVALEAELAFLGTPAELGIDTGDSITFTALFTGEGLFEVPIPEPTPGPTPTTEPNPNSLTLVFDSEPVGMNYLLHLTALSDTPIRDNMVDPLTWQSGIPEDNLKIVPTTMVTGWENINETTWRFFLREGVTFHNGEVLNADSALPSMIFQGADVEATSADYTGNFTPVKVDDMTIDLVCDTNCPILPRTTIFLNIMPGDYFTNATDEEKELQGYGAGPYQQVEFTDTELVYEAYPDYVPVGTHFEFQQAIIPEIRWLWRSEQVTKAAMVAAGEADMAWDIGVDLVDVAPAVKQGFAAEGLSMKVMTLGCNWHPELCKLEIRQAIAHSIDCQAIADQIYKGLTTCRGTNEFPGVTGTTAENTAPHTYDPDLSLQLQADAGYESEPATQTA